MSVIIDPIRIYEVQGQVCPLLDSGAPGAATPLAVGTTQIVAASTGKIIRVMGLRIISAVAAANSNAQFRSAAAGVIINTFITPGYNTGLPTFLPIVDCGYFETLVSEALYCTVGVNDCYLSVWYIVYKPS